MVFKEAFSQYYRLAKPGIVYGNSIAFVAGYFAYASTLWIDIGDFLLALVGIALVMGSSCVANNMYDRDIDSKMTRTKKRALVIDEISIRDAGIYAFMLVVMGSYLQYVSGGWLAAVLGLTGWMLYAIVYTRAKRRTKHSTLIGTVPGAIPPVIGYVAAGGSIDIVATLLFVAMIGWQMVHFFAIALYRKDDYQAAGIPVMPLATSNRRTIAEMRWYGLLYMVAAISLGYWFGIFYTIATIGICLWMVQKFWYSSSDIQKWARLQFKTSLFILLLWSLAIVIAAVQ